MRRCAIEPRAGGGQCGRISCDCAWAERPPRRDG